MLGALHDGTFSSNKRFRISQKGTEWLEVMKHLLKSINYSSWIYQEGKTRDVYVLETLADFLDFNSNHVIGSVFATRSGLIVKPGKPPKQLEGTQTSK